VEKQETTDNKDPIFDLICSEELINKITNEVISNIESSLDIKRCSDSFASSDEIKNDLNSYSIQEILNSGLILQLKDPKTYIFWEKDVMNQLKSKLK